MSPTHPVAHEALGAAAARSAARRHAGRCDGVRGRLALAVTLCLIGLGLGAGTARAASGTVAVVPAPAVAAELRAELGQAVVQAALAAHLSAVGAAELEAALQGESALRTCNMPSCLERLGTLLNAGSVLVFSAAAEGAAAGRATYQLQLDAYDVEVGAQAASMTSTCSRCTPADAAKNLRELAKQVIATALAKPRGTLALDTEPPGAQVRVDGSETGRTPYQRPAFSGSHAVVLSAPGYHSQKATVTVAESHTSRLEVRLIAGSDGGAKGDGGRKPVYKKWWFWVAIGGAAAAAAAVTAGVVVSQMNGAAQPPQSINHIVF